MHTTIEVPFNAYGALLQDRNVPGPIESDEPAPGGAAPEPVARYLREIARVPLLTAAEERALCERIEAAHHALTAAVLACCDATTPTGPAAIEAVAAAVVAQGAGAAAERVQRQLTELHALKQQLVEANLRLVVAVAKRYRRSDLSLLDRIQEGNVGLLKAVDRFEYRRGFRLSTYATWWIRQAISKAITDTGRTVRLPAHLVLTLNRIGAARGALAGELGRQPTAGEIAARTHLPVEKVASALRASAPAISLDAPVGEHAVFGEFLPDQETPRPDARLLADDASRHAQRALRSLKPRDRMVLELRLGIGNRREHTLQEIAEQLGISRERVRQLEQAALQRLKRRLSTRPSRSIRRPPMPPTDAEHHPMADDERLTREAALDETIQASFPASDPPSTNPNPDDHEALERTQDS